MALPLTIVREHRTETQEDTLGVLIIEDEGRPKSLLHHLQHKRGIGVDITHDPRNARLLACSASYDVVMLQIPVRGGDAMELCRQVRADGVTTPILVVAQHGSVDEIVSALHVGADDFMVEPIGVDLLMARHYTFKRRSKR